jgi:(1->4)-alpha-D-glucan 1-alpha-D-glucosylmutase
LLKLTCPGVPDIYQGNDLFDFSLVDPDNRRPVDYSRRREFLETLQRVPDDKTGTNALEQLIAAPEDGRLKLFLTWRALCLRKRYLQVFRDGEYVPLVAEGVNAKHVVAFMRKFEDLSILVVAPRLVANIVGDSRLPPIGENIWKDTYLVLPSNASFSAYRNAFTGELLETKPLIARKARPLLCFEVSGALGRFPLGLYFSTTV